MIPMARCVLSQRVSANMNIPASFQASPLHAEIDRLEFEHYDPHSSSRFGGVQFVKDLGGFQGLHAEIDRLEFEDTARCAKTWTATLSSLNSCW